MPQLEENRTLQPPGGPRGYLEVIALRRAVAIDSELLAGARRHVLGGVQGPTHLQLSGHVVLAQALACGQCLGHRAVPAPEDCPGSLALLGPHRAAAVQGQRLVVLQGNPLLPLDPREWDAATALVAHRHEEGVSHSVLSMHLAGRPCRLHLDAACRTHLWVGYHLLLGALASPCVHHCCPSRHKGHSLARLACIGWHFQAGIDALRRG
mmetsp:Transcript_85916/g.256227  ORF Transcript_85916/g.256227 Transcript_85916/m.256227 type:complete len:209 (-) Transcript_85916:245-871(-)